MASIQELYKKNLYDPDNHEGVITHLEPDIHRQSGALDTGREAQQGYSGRAKWGLRGTGEGGLPSKGAGRWEWRDEERMVTSRLGKLWEAWGDLCERSFSGGGLGNNQLRVHTSPTPIREGRKGRRTRASGALLSRK